MRSRGDAATAANAIVQNEAGFRELADRSEETTGNQGDDGKVKHRFALVLVVLVLIPGAASMFAQGPLPGDIAATLALQSVLGEAPAWAVSMTNMAKAPWLWASTAAALAIAGWAGGMLRAFSPLIAYALAWGADQLLRYLIFVPRPDAAWVSVASASSSSGLPSTFGLVFGALFGAAFWIAGGGARKKTALALSLVLLTAGAAARIVLGGHWFSQMLPSFALGILLAGLAVWLIENPARRFRMPTRAHPQRSR